MTILWIGLGFLLIESILWIFFRKELFTNLFMLVLNWIIGDRSKNG